MSGVAGILHIRMYVKSVGNLNDGSRLNCHQRESIAEGGDLMYYCSTYAQKIISSTIAQIVTSAPLFAMQCWLLYGKINCKLSK